MQKRTLGLALGAGGARGVCHLGFLQVLKKHKIEISCLSGSSMGAVVGGAFASGGDLCEMEETIKSVKQIELMDMNVLPITKKGLVKGIAAKMLIDPHLEVKKFEDMPIPFSCVAVDLLSGECDILNSGDLLTAIRASFSIPGVFEPVSLNGKLYVDGGVLCRLPIKAVKMFKPDVVVAVDAVGEAVKVDSMKSIFDVIFRSFDLLDWQNTQKIASSADLLISPVMKTAKVYHTKYIKEALEAGYKAGEDNIGKIKELVGFE